MAPLQKVLGVRDVVLMNVVAIVGLRTVSLSAASGNTAITLWLGALVTEAKRTAVCVFLKGEAPRSLSAGAGS